MGGWTAAGAGKASGAGKRTATRGYARGPEIFTRPCMPRGTRYKYKTSRVPGSTALCPLGLGGVSISRLLHRAPSPSTVLLSFVVFSGFWSSSFLPDLAPNPLAVLVGGNSGWQAIDEWCATLTSCRQCIALLWLELLPGTASG